MDVVKQVKISLQRETLDTFFPGYLSEWPESIP